MKNKKKPVSQLERIKENIQKYNRKNLYMFKYLSRNIKVTKRKALKNHHIDIHIYFNNNNYEEQLDKKFSFIEKYFLNNLETIALKIKNTVLEYEEILRNSLSHKERRLKEAIDVVKYYKLTKLPSNKYYWKFSGTHQKLRKISAYYKQLGTDNRTRIEINKLFKKHSKLKTKDIYIQIIQEEENELDRRLEIENTLYLEQNKRSRAYNKPYIQHEKIARTKFNKKLFPLLKSLGYTIKEEYKVCPESNHRIDYLITKVEFSLGIEYKSSKAFWSSGHLKLFGVVDI